MSTNKALHIRKVARFLLIFIVVSLSIPYQAAADFRFGSLADTKSGTSYLATLSNQLKPLNPAFVIFEGDLEDRGFTLSGMTTWKNAMNGNSANGMFDITLPVRGNHDDSDSAGWQSFYDMRGAAGRICTNHGGTWNSSSGICSGGTIGPVNFSELNSDLTYSFDYENAHIVGLDVPGDKDGASAGTVTWLDNDLTAAEARGQTLAFVYLHGPIWPISYHCCDQSNPSLDQALYKHKSVAATLHGHEHVFAYTHINTARVANTTSATSHEFEQFHTGNAGAEGGEACPSSSYCKPERWDYFMTYGTSNTPRGFTTVDVSGSNFTVRFYYISTSTPQETMTFNHNTATGYTHCTSFSATGNSVIDGKLASVCASSVPSPTPGGATSTPTSTPTTRTPTPVPQKTGDTNNDTFVNLNDLATLLSNFGKSNLSWNNGDFNGDHLVNLSDLSALLSNFGR